jgi:hypothetical protein
MGVSGCFLKVWGRLMRKYLRTVSIGISVGLAGCAIHPLPEDVTGGVDTFMIAQKIRCEARQAVLDNMADYLIQYGESPATRQMGAEFKDGTRPFSSFKDSLFHGYVKDNIQKFENSAIAYNFTLDMTEINNLDATVDLSWPFARGSGTASISTTGIDRTRENIRTFTLTDTFLGLTKVTYCNGSDVSGKNYLYPMTGTIGVYEMIHTFAYLAVQSNLSGANGGPPTMGDTIIFTTKLQGSAVPKLVFSPVKALQVADASLNASASRTDQHKLLVGLALPGKTAAGAKTTSSTQVGFLVGTKGSATDAEIAAAKTIEQIIVRFELARPGAVIPNTTQ